MFKLLFIILFIPIFCFGGLPPTTSKLSGDVNPVTTFNYEFPYFTGTHTGVTTSLNLLGVTGGGTGINGSTAANGSILIGNGTGYTLDTIDPTTNQTTVTNGAGTIQIGTVQDIATTSTPQFNDVQVLGTGLGNRFLGRTLALASSTGVVSGGVLSVGAPTNTFSISDGAGEVVDVTNPASPVVTPVTWTGLTNIAVTNIGSQPVTYVLIGAGPTVIQQSTYPTPDERRNAIFLGRLNHFNLASISFADTFPDYKLSPISGFFDLTDALAPFRISGVVPSANGANLSFNISAGTAFFRSANYATDIEDPNYITFPGATPQAFRKMTQTATTDVADVTVVDPANYDVGGTVTAIGGSVNTSSIQRVYAYKSGAFRVQYGQNIYSNLASALTALPTETFIPNPTIEYTAILVGFIVAERTCADLTAACARIIPAARFDAGGGSSVGGTTTLQQAYLNSVQPQITLNSTQLGIQVRDASTPIGATLFAIQNNAGSTSYLGVDVNGLSTTNFVGTGTTGAVRVHNLTTTQKNALTPAAGMIVYDTTLNRMECYVNGIWDGCTRPVLSTQSPTAGASLTLDLTIPVQRIRLTPASPISLSATLPLGSSDPQDGAIVILVGTSDTNTVTWTASDTGNGIYKFGKTLGKGDTATLIYSATDDRFYYLATGN